MRTRLPHLFDNWLPFIGVAIMFTDAFGDTFITGWGPASDWAGWLILAAFIFCQYKFVSRHTVADCVHCPSTDRQGRVAARRSRLMLRAVHLIAPLGLIVHRLGGGPVALGAALVVALLAAPIFFLGWIAPDGFTLAFVFTYVALLHTSLCRHAHLTRWCPWCHHGGGGGGGGGGGDDHPDPEPMPTKQRDLTLAA